MGGQASSSVSRLGMDVIRTGSSQNGLFVDCFFFLTCALQGGLCLLHVHYLRALGIQERQEGGEAEG